MAQQIAESIETSMEPFPAPIPDGVVPSVPTAIVVEGPVASGKTQKLAERVCGLLKDGADPGDILVFCATPDACAAFARRLSGLLDQPSPIAPITTREWCLDLFAQPGPRAATGRGGRLLAPFEVNFLLEDLKISGVKPHRIREMIKFFDKSVTELCDWEDGWLITEEERLVYGLIQDNLRFTGGMLEAEVANVAVRYLKDDPAARARAQVAHVLVDDYQMLSRASQVLASYLAAESIAVAANRNACIEVFDSYPYGKGLDEFNEANPGAEQVALDQVFACEDAVRAARALEENSVCEDGRACLPEVLFHRRHGDGAAAKGKPQDLAGKAKVEFVETEGPAQEMGEVVGIVREALADGSLPQDVAVVVPNRTWRSAATLALKRAGIAASGPTSPKAISGDPRDLARCASERVLVALFLAADPHDRVAWRAWCGFGEHFTSSSAWKVLREALAGKEVTAQAAIRALEQAAGEEVARQKELDHVKNAIFAGQDLVKAVRDLRGDDLLAAIADRLGVDTGKLSVVRALVAVEPGGAGGPSAQDMAKTARSRLLAPRVEDADAVRVLSLSELAGLSPDVLVLSGFVDGFFPRRGVLDREAMVEEDAEKQMRKDVALLANAIGKPRKRLVATAFKEIGLMNAERLDLRINRVLVREGTRMARAQRSFYLDLIEG